MNFVWIEKHIRVQVGAGSKQLPCGRTIGRFGRYFIAAALLSRTANAPDTRTSCSGIATLIGSGINPPLYGMLFDAVNATLSEFSANPRWLGGTGHFTLVLHTWEQDLGRRVHIHALVAGGALGQDVQWLRPRCGFLLPVKALSTVYRGKFIAVIEATTQRRIGRTG